MKRTLPRRLAPLALLPLCVVLAQCNDDPLEAPPPTTIQIVDAFPNLTFAGPLAFMQAPGDATRAFVATQSGIVHVFPFSASTTQGQVQAYLDIDARVTNDGGEQGLLGIAFDPQYAGNGLFYVHYNPNFDGTTTVRRSQVSRFSRTSADASNAASEASLLTWDQPVARNNHKGGWIGFGPDNRLYIASGDGGGSGDPDNNAQNTNNLLGKILRINSDGSIPSDNPFVGVAGRDEIWAFGLRNPYRASFDFDTARLIAGDVGQGSWEEINRIVKGGNYGWRKFEGPSVFNASDPDPGNAIAPDFSYSHSSGRCSIIGGYVYRGTALPGYSGWYFFADYCTGEVFALSSLTATTARFIGDVPGNPRSFGEDLAKELYITSGDGNVYKLVPET